VQVVSVGVAMQLSRLVTLVVSVAHVVDVHLELNTDGNIVPSESEYVPVQAVAVGSLKHFLTTSRSEVRVVHVVPSHFDASTVGRDELEP